MQLFVNEKCYDLEAVATMHLHEGTFVLSAIPIQREEFS